MHQFQQLIYDLRSAAWTPAQTEPVGYIVRTAMADFAKQMILTKAVPRFRLVIP